MDGRKFTTCNGVAEKVSPFETFAEWRAVDKISINTCEFFWFLFVTCGKNKRGNNG